MLLAEHVIVPIFDEKLRPSWVALLRSAGADVRTDLPSERSNAGDGGEKTCVVVVQKDAALPSQAAGLLERAKVKQVPAASQDWIKHCLLEQRVLELAKFPVKPK